jgi:hypothetical protein
MAGKITRSARNVNISDAVPHIIITNYIDGHIKKLRNKENRL